MAKDKPTPSQQVDEYIAKLPAALSALAQAVRESILAVGSEVGEHIKWNSLAFFYTGEMKPFDPKEYKRDIVVYNIRKKPEILLVFPTGAVIDDTAKILEGSYTDGRRMVTIKNMTDFENKKEALQAVIKLWLDKVEK